VANAGLALGTLLFVMAWLGASSREVVPASVCPHPVEYERVEDRTVAIRCAAGPSQGPPIRGPAVLLFGRAIDLNRADARTLESLPGIGPGRARAIVEARALRPFATLEELQRVKGIGPRTVEGLRGWARVGTVGRATDPSRDGMSGPALGKGPTLDGWGS
jgi:hypothetical protein